VPPLHATNFENGYPATEKLVCSAGSEERVCNNYAMCIFHTVLFGFVVPCAIVCKMHIAQLLKLTDLSLLTAEHTSSCVVRSPFSKLMASSTDAKQQQLQRSFETKLESFFIGWFGCEVLSMPHLFPVSS
jgi:hypothetical protein